MICDRLTVVSLFKTFRRKRDCKFRYRKRAVFVYYYIVVVRGFSASFVDIDRKLIILYPGIGKSLREIRNESFPVRKFVRFQSAVFYFQTVVYLFVIVRRKRYRELRYRERAVIVIYNVV